MQIHIFTQMSSSYDYNETEVLNPLRQHEFEQAKFWVGNYFSKEQTKIGI